MFIFSADNPFRVFVAKLVGNIITEIFLMTTIVISSVILAMENPLNDPNGYLSLVLYKVEICIVCIFLSEVVLKVISLGFVANG